MGGARQGVAKVRCYTPRRSRWEPMDGFGKAFGYFALFSEIGLVLLVTTLGGALAGHWLDERLGTGPLLVVLGFLMGALLGAVADWRLISRFLERSED